MIIFGWHTNTKQVNRADDLACFECEQVGQVSINRSIKSFHLFFIPLFPIGISHEAECQSCKTSLKYSEMGPELSTVYKKYKTQSIPPIWHFSGLLIILALAVWGWNSNRLDKSELQSKLDTLAVGRILTIKIEPDAYSTIKICKVEGEKVYGFQNAYQVSSAGSVSNIQLAENYVKDTLEIDKSLLQTWFEEDKIIDIYWGTYEDMNPK